MKAWKKEKSMPVLDYGDRDGPCIILNNQFLVGGEDDSHSSMVQKQLYGVVPKECGYEYEWETWCRDNIMSDYDEDKVLYGSILKNVIYWEAYKPLDDIRKILSTVKDIPSKYDHFAKLENGVTRLFKKY